MDAELPGTRYVGGGGVAVAGAEVGISAVEVGGRESGIDFYGFVECVDGSGVVVHLQQQCAAVEVGGRETGRVFRGAVEV